MLIFDSRKRQMSVRLQDAHIKQLNSFITEYKSKTNQEIKEVKELFLALLNVAENNIANLVNQEDFNISETELNKLKDSLSNSEARVIEQNDIIEKQSETIKSLQNLADKQSGFEAELLKIQADFEKSMNNENDKVSNLQNQISDLKSKFSISDFQYSLAVANIRKNKEAVEVLRKMFDKYGKGIYETLSPYSEENADTSEENVFNFILNSFMHSALYQRALSSVLTKSQIETSIANFKSNKK